MITSNRATFYVTALDELSEQPSERFDYLPEEKINILEDKTFDLRREIRGIKTESSQIESDLQSLSFKIQ
jgi:hypothetical protein